ncbi:MAG: CBS domain-containing protein [Elusimicrobia bacterium]|nr:CBS domain-containing protein [Elusimicrobiota bacterium]
MDRRTAKDLMIPLDEYPHVPYWFTLCQAMAEFEKAEFDVGGRKSLPRVVLVFNEAYELLGMVRRRDILRGLEPESLSHILRPGLFGSKTPAGAHETLSKKIIEKLQRPVSDIMTPIRESVDHADDLVKVMLKMVEHNLSFVPVMKDKEVIGVVRTVELIGELAQLCHLDKTDKREK